MRRDAAQNRARILEYAETLHKEGEISSMKMTDIASGAGVSVGTFYRNFPDRCALCEELVHAHFEKTVDRIEALSRNAGLGDRKRISSAVMEYLSFRKRDGDLIAECGDGTYQGKPFYQTDTFERLMASFVRILSPLLKGRSEEEIRFRSEMLAAMMRSDIYAYERMVRKLSNREIVNRLIAVIVPGAGGVTGSL